MQPYWIHGPGPRGGFGQYAALLCRADQVCNTDGNSESVEDQTWTKLKSSIHKTIQSGWLSIHTSPFTLEVRSEGHYLAVGFARALAITTGGKTSRINKGYNDEIGESGAAPDVGGGSLGPG
jgi:hypothetical protein